MDGGTTPKLYLSDNKYNYGMGIFEFMDKSISGFP